MLFHQSGSLESRRRLLLYAYWYIFLLFWLHVSWKLFFCVKILLKNRFTGETNEYVHLLKTCSLWPGEIPEYDLCTPSTFESLEKSRKAIRQSKYFLNFISYYWVLFFWNAIPFSILTVFSFCSSFRKQIVRRFNNAASRPRNRYRSPASISSSSYLSKTLSNVWTSARRASTLSSGAASRFLTAPCHTTAPKHNFNPYNTTYQFQHNLSMCIFDTNE